MAASMFMQAFSMCRRCGTTRSQPPGLVRGRMPPRWRQRRRSSASGTQPSLGAWSRSSKRHARAAVILLHTRQPQHGVTVCLHPSLEGHLLGLAARGTSCADTAW